MLFDPVTISLLLGYLLDLIIGDPVYPFHPVRVMGRAANLLEIYLRGKFRREFVAGLIFVVIIVLVFTTVSWAIVFVFSLISFYVSLAFSIFFIYSSISIRDLARHAVSVKNALIVRDMDIARRKVSLMVSRRTENLNENEIIRAVIESVSENILDGIISPLFYASVFGAAGAVGYKAVNTLDSMVGYKNAQYINFGRASARLDDALNFIPARLSIMIFALAALLCGRNPIRILRVVFRDRGKSASPNSGIPVAAIAGALDIRLGGTCDYNGKKMNKPEFGGERRELGLADIDSCVRLAYISSVLTVVLAILLRIGILILLLPHIRL